MFPQDFLGFRRVQARDSEFKLGPESWSGPCKVSILARSHAPLFFQIILFWPKTWSEPVRTSVYDIPGLYYINLKSNQTMYFTKSKKLPHIPSKILRIRDVLDGWLESIRNRFCNVLECNCLILFWPNDVIRFEGKMLVLTACLCHIPEAP